MKKKHTTPLEECRIQFQQLSEELVKVNTKLDSILNIRVNGTVGFEAAMQELYVVTSGLRASKKLSTAFRDWILERKVKILVPILTFLIGWLIWGDLWDGLWSLVRSVLGLL